MAKVFIQDLAEQMASTFGYQVADTQLFVRTFFETIVRGLERDKYVRLKGLGTFKMIEVDDRESINVNTGERFMIQGHAKVSFQPDNGLKELINKPFAHFETVVLNDNLSEEDFLEVDRKFENLEEPEMADDVEEQPLLDIAQMHTVTETSLEVASPSADLVMADEMSKTVEDESKLTDEPAIPVTDESKKVEEPLKLAVKEQVIVEIPAESPVVDEMTTSEESVIIEEKVDEEPVVEAPVQENNHAHEVPENNVPMIRPQAEEPETVVCKSNTYTYLWSALCVVFLLVGYVMGYFNLLTPKVIKQKVVVRDTIFVPKIVHDTIRIEAALPVAKTEVKVENIVGDSTSQPAPKPKAATTVLPRNAAYEIVGTKETYTLRNGETLRILAERYYGNRNMATYIIAHNNITDPNLVAVGTIIKIPELKPKNK